MRRPFAPPSRSFERDGRARELPCGFWCSSRREICRSPDFQPPFCAAGMLVSAHDRGVDNEVFKVWIICENCKHIVPNTFLAPPTEPAKDAVPIAKFIRQIAPWCAGSYQPKHSFDEHPIVTSRRTALIWSSNDAV